MGCEGWKGTKRKKGKGIDLGDKAIDGQLEGLLNK